MTRTEAPALADLFSLFERYESSSMRFALIGREVKHFNSTSVKEIDIVQLGIVSQAGLKLLLRAQELNPTVYQRQVNARTIEFKSDKEIIEKVTKSTNPEHEPGVGRRLPVGTGSSSRISPEPNQDYCTREQIMEIIRQEVADKERWKKAADEASQHADLAKKQAELANERAARVELVLDNWDQHTPIPDPYSDPNRYFKVMNPGSSRIPNDDEDGDDQDGNDEDGNGNNEDGNGCDESSSASDAE
ncbi:hypothetical protein Tco_0359287 [Tanacetum coccineum]